MLAAANTGPMLFSFLAILPKYEKEAAFLPKRSSCEQALPGECWC